MTPVRFGLATLAGIGFGTVLVSALTSGTTKLFQAIVGRSHPRCCRRLRNPRRLTVVWPKSEYPRK